MKSQIRPKSSRNKASLIAEGMLDHEVEALTRKLIDLALSGDMTALKLCFEGLLRGKKDQWPLIYRR